MWLAVWVDADGMNIDEDKLMPKYIHRKTSIRPILVEYQDADGSITGLIKSYLHCIANCMDYINYTYHIGGMNQISSFCRWQLLNSFSRWKMFAFWFKVHWSVFFPTGLIVSISALVHAMAWHRSSAKPLPDPMLTQMSDSMVLCTMPQGSKSGLMTAPSHCLNQCWFTITKAHWLSFEYNFTRVSHQSLKLAGKLLS